MNILITAGGTKVKIDDVRWLGNFSKGGFGAKLADSFLSKGHEVWHLHDKDATVPINRHNAKYHSVPFLDYYEYASKLEGLLKGLQFDFVLLAAAVSDYGPADQISGKMSSDLDEINIKLVRLPKLIARVKEWSPRVIQVGFKLLAKTSVEDMLKIGMAAGEKVQSDFTVVNDVQTVYDKRHEVHLIQHGTNQINKFDVSRNVDKFVQAIIDAGRK